MFFFYHRFIGCLSTLKKSFAWCIFFFGMKKFLLRVKQKTPKGSCCTAQTPPQVKYLQFVESITQYGVHLRWPYDLQEEAKEEEEESTSVKNKEAGGLCHDYKPRWPWKVWVACLVSKVLSITLLSTLVAVSVSTVGMFTLCGQKRESVGRSSEAEGDKIDHKKSVDAALTDTVVSDHSVFVIALLPVGNLHDAITTVTFIVRSIFHGLERRQLEWKHLLQMLKI